MKLLLVVILSIFILLPVCAEEPVVHLTCKDALAHNNDGVTKLNNTDYAGARVEFDEAIRIDPNYDLAYYNRMIANQGLRDYDGIIRDYEILTQLRDQLQHGTGETAGQTVLSLIPQETIADYYAKRGLAKQKLGDNLSAIESFTQAVRLAPKAAQY
ncbi:MAG TPA: hypothetical protein V6C81_20650 [Planktothrix sp.]|jgi:tetratricopeptide (TPR) repeat protein